MLDSGSAQVLGALVFWVSTAVVSPCGLWKVPLLCG